MRENPFPRSMNSIFLPRDNNPLVVATYNQKKQETAWLLVLAFFFLGEYKAFALSGRIVHSWITQGVALG